MNIDLLFTQKGEGGLVANENFIKKIIGVVLDTDSGLLSLEYSDGDLLDLNVPIDQEYFEPLDYNPTLHIGAVKNGNIAQAYQVPLMFSDDPYRTQNQKPVSVDSPLVAFEYYMRSCVAGQPAHREDLDDDSLQGCILGDASPSALEFAPHLARRHKLEIAPTMAPGAAPGLGLGTSGGGGGVARGSGIVKGGEDE